MMATPWGMIKDPVHGYVHISEDEQRVMDTLPMQRLRRIKQLVFADYVYPGANHTRFEHSIGVMHLAGVLGRSLPVGMGEEELQRLRLAGLCRTSVAARSRTPSSSYCSRSSIRPTRT